MAAFNIQIIQGSVHIEIQTNDPTIIVLCLDSLLKRSTGKIEITDISETTSQV